MDVFVLFSQLVCKTFGQQWSRSCPGGHANHLGVVAEVSLGLWVEQTGQVAAQRRAELRAETGSTNLNRTTKRDIIATLEGEAVFYNVFRWAVSAEVCLRVPSKCWKVFRCICDALFHLHLRTVVVSFRTDS